MQYKENQPFNENHLRPCPVLDNPEKYKHMVDESGAYSTQPIDREDVRDLTAKQKNRLRTGHQLQRNYG